MAFYEHHSGQALADTGHRHDADVQDVAAGPEMRREIEEEDEDESGLDTG